MTVHDVLEWLVGKPRRSRRPRRPQANPLAHLSAVDRHALTAARELSQEFHGTPSQVLELSPRERHLPRFVVAAGEVQEFVYAPSKGTQHGDSAYRHAAGDRGPLRPRARAKPVLAVNPHTRKPVLVSHRSPMRFGRGGFSG